MREKDGWRTGLTAWGVLFLSALLAAQACSPDSATPAARRLRLRNGILARFRLFHELTPYHVDRRILERKISALTRPDPAACAAVLASARRLAAQTEELCGRFAEDAGAFSTGEDAAAAGSFVARASAYVESLRDCSSRLLFIAERLDRVTRRPKSWTLREYENAAADYARATAEMSLKASAFDRSVGELGPH